LKFFTGIFLVTGLFFLLSCKEEPHELTANIYDSNIQGVVKDTTLYAIQDTFYYQTSKVNTQFANRLGFGSYAGIEVRPILRFTNFETLPNRLTVDSAWIKLFTTGSLSDGNPTPIFSRLYPVLNLWRTNLDSVWSNYLDNIDQTILIGELEIAPEDTNQYLFELTSDGINLVNTWTDTATATDDNFGLILDFDNANFIQYFGAINSGFDPQLIVRYTVPDDTTVFHDTLTATFDAFIYEGDFNRISERNYSSSLIVYNTVLDFGLGDFISSFPSDIVSDISILSANIQMPIDRQNSLIDPSFNVSNQIVLNLVSEVSDPSTEADSATGLFASSRKWSDDSTYIELVSDANRTTFAAMIRRQLTNPGDNSGFVLSITDNASNKSSRVSFEKEQFAYLAFYTTKEPALERRARLIIKYWQPASPRL
jgi:hypothetical protein